ncbi:unnamed protein product [Moneuplotes crassus]|uniref:Uncharacterized protein n=1 Tax=Euplotes crassus TaxID=5936 RepID=A0AAD1UGI3_EUPCR|nr:unnamed protein product [Moneuplotes crassus]
MEATHKLKIGGRPVIQPSYPVIPMHSQEYEKFLKFLAIINKNCEKLDHIGACTKCWQLLDQLLIDAHIKVKHECIPISSLHTEDKFLDIAKKYSKINDDKSLVCLLDLNQIQHLMPKIHKMLEEETKKIEEKKKKKAKRPNNPKNATNTKEPKKAQAIKKSPKERLPKGKCHIEYKDPDNRDLEVEFFKSRTCNMLDSMYKDIENLKQSQRELEHKFDMLVHKLDSNTPSLNVLPLLGQNSLQNIFPKVYSSKQTDFFNFLSRLFADYNRKREQHQKTQQVMIDLDEYEDLEIQKDDEQAKKDPNQFQTVQRESPGQAGQSNEGNQSFVQNVASNERDETGRLRQEDYKQKEATCTSKTLEKKDISENVVSKGNKDIDSSMHQKSGEEESKLQNHKQIDKTSTSSTAVSQTISKQSIHKLPPNPVDNLLRPSSGQIPSATPKPPSFVPLVESIFQGSGSQSLNNLSSTLNMHTSTVPGNNLTLPAPSPPLKLPASALKTLPIQSSNPTFAQEQHPQDPAGNAEVVEVEK